MRLLIIGGTRFLGRHLAALALERGHAVTLLHRGRSASGLFTDADHRFADRNDDLAALSGTETWDACIDTCGYVPRHVRSLAAVIGKRVGQYQFVSSISVYDGYARESTDEACPLARLADPAAEAVTAETYGGLKAACEEAARQAFGDRALIVRPGLIVGPFDRSGRFTWWVARLVRAARVPQASEVLAPGDPGGPLQIVDARDLAAWQLGMAERADAGGSYNVVGPQVAMTMGEFLWNARSLLAPEATLTWVDECFLQQHTVAPWTEMPLWLPAADAGVHRVDARRALATGLTCRPLAATLADTAAWTESTPAGGLIEGIGLAPEREAGILHAWRSQGVPEKSPTQRKTG